MSSIGIKELLDAGVHFGHQTRRWNPKMKRFIFDARNGIHIIDLSQTVQQLDAACAFVAGVVGKGGQVLFVGTKKQAQEVVRECARASGQPYVTGRWLGGTLTNFKTIRQSLKRLTELEQMEADGSMGQYGKQEQSALRREAARILKNLEGVREMNGIPDAVFIVDIKREHNAIAEARRLRVPVVAIVDTNCDPDLVDYPVAGNDDALRSVRLILSTIAQAATTARAEYEAKYGRQKAAEAAPAPAPPTEPPAAVATA
jgi:small subunit ribosomal protein S2